VNIAVKLLIILKVQVKKIINLINCAYSSLALGMTIVASTRGELLRRDLEDRNRKCTLKTS
jgi:hypothetical protein